MKTIPALALLITVSILGNGCATSIGTTGRKGALNLQMPAPGKSKVVFIRPGSFGGSIAFSVHDNDKLIGVLPYNAFFEYECEPGKRLFSSSMEDVAVLDAELLPDRIYYAKVSAAMGWLTAQVNMYSLHPNCAGDLWPKLPKMLKSLRETKLTPELIEKDRKGITAYMERVQGYHREKYLPNAQREQILPDHGQTKSINAP